MRLLFQDFFKQGLAVDTRAVLGNPAFEVSEPDRCWEKENLGSLR